MLCHPSPHIRPTAAFEQSVIDELAVPDRTIPPGIKNRAEAEIKGCPHEYVGDQVSEHSTPPPSGASAPEPHVQPVLHKS